MRKETKLRKDVNKAFRKLNSVSFSVQTLLGSGMNMNDAISDLNDAMSKLSTALKAYAAFRKCQWCAFRVEKEPRKDSFIYPGLKKDGPCSKGNSPELLQDGLMASMGFSRYYYAKEDCPDFESDKEGK